MIDPKACVISIMDANGKRLQGFRAQMRINGTDVGGDIPKDGPMSIIFDKQAYGAVADLKLFGPARAGGAENFAHRVSLHLSRDSYVEFRLRECQDAISFDEALGHQEIPLDLIALESPPVAGVFPEDYVVPLDWVPVRVTVKPDTAQTGVSGYLVWFHCNGARYPITHKFRVPVGTSTEDATTRTLRLPAQRGGFVCKLRALDSNGKPTGGEIDNMIHLTVDHPKGAWIHITPGQERAPEVLNLYQELVQSHKGKSVGFDYPFAAYDNSGEHGVWLGQVLDEKKIHMEKYVKSRIAAMNPSGNPDKETLVDARILAYGGHELNEPPAAPPRSYIVFNNSNSSNWTAYPWTRETETAHATAHLTRNWRVTDLLVEWTTQTNP